ncbi:MAG: TraB/GumN family protein [Pseudomonadota bacterium]
MPNVKTRLRVQTLRAARALTMSAAAAAFVFASAPGHAQQSSGGAATDSGCTGKDMRPALRAAGLPPLKDVAATTSLGANSGHLLWKVEKAGLPTSYLMGTLHSSDPRIAKIAPAVEQALAAVNVLALEILDGSNTELAGMMMSQPQKFFYTGREDLSVHLTPDELKRGQAIAGTLGIPFEKLQPWFAMTTIAIPACELMATARGAKVLDAALEARARALGKTVVALETPVGQIEAIRRIPESQTVNMLKAALGARSSIDDQFETMKQLYLEGQIGEIWALSLLLADQANIPRSEFSAFKQELLAKRNIKMVDTATDQLQTGGLMIAVGALHLVGDQGLVALVRKAGYTVTAVQ